MRMIDALAVAALTIASLDAAPALAWDEPRCDPRDHPTCGIKKVEVSKGPARGREFGFMVTLDDDGDPVTMLSLVTEAVNWPKSVGMIALLCADGRAATWRRAAVLDDGAVIFLDPEDLDILSGSQELEVTLPGLRVTYPMAGAGDALKALLAAFATRARTVRQPGADL